MLDKFLRTTLVRATPLMEKSYVATRRTIPEDERTHILYDMDIIDSKSAALLTHVSVMLAVIAVLITQSESVWRWIMIAELTAFCLVGMLLLRCVDVMGPPYRVPPDDEENLRETYCDEVLLRRGVYQAMLRTVFGLTAALIAIVISKAITT